MLVTKSRVIAEVRTYQELEMKKETSTDYCLFEPKTEKLEAEVVKVPKAKEKGKKDKKDKKSKKDTNTTKSTTKQLDNVGSFSRRDRLLIFSVTDVGRYHGP